MPESLPFRKEKKKRLTGYDTEELDGWKARAESKTLCM